MPIYEYECEACSGHYEVFQKITARPLRKCDRCGGKLHKLISQSSFHLKGAGWYVTDYAKQDKGKNEPESKPSPKPKAEKKQGESTKAKPEAKSKD